MAILNSTLLKAFCLVGLSCMVLFGLVIRTRDRWNEIPRSDKIDVGPVLEDVIRQRNKELSDSLSDLVCVEGENYEECLELKKQWAERDWTVIASGTIDCEKDNCTLIEAWLERKRSEYTMTDFFLDVVQSECKRLKEMFEQSQHEVILMLMDPDPSLSDEILTRRIRISERYNQIEEEYNARCKLSLSISFPLEENDGSEPECESCSSDPIIMGDDDKMRVAQS